DQAARLFGAEEALREAIGAPVAHHRARHDQAIAAVRDGLGATAFATAWAAGRAMPLADAVAEAIAVSPSQSRDAGSDHEPTAAEWFGLTRREVEVLRHLVAGRS